MTDVTHSENVSPEERRINSHQREPKKKIKVSQNDVDVNMSIGDSAALRSSQTTEKIIGGVYSGVNPATSRWG